MTPSIECFLDVDIEIRVPPERVWRAWTTPEEFTAWWGEDGKYQVTEWTGDVRPGGKWRADGLLADGARFFVEGTYVRVEPPAYLSFTWRHDWDEGITETVVSLEFVATATGTLLKLHHSGFATDEARTSHDRGWVQVLGWLHRHLQPEE